MPNTESTCSAEYDKNHDAVMDIVKKYSCSYYTKSGELKTVLIQDYFVDKKPSFKHLLKKKK